MVSQGEQPQTGAERRDIGRVLIGAMIVGFVLLMVAVGATAWINVRMRDHMRWITHTYEVERDLADVAGALERSEAGRRGYILTGQQRGRNVAIENAAEVDRRVIGLGKLTADNPRQAPRLREVRRLLTVLERTRARSIVQVDAGRREQATFEIGSDNTGIVIPRLRVLLGQMRAEERRLLAQRDAELRLSVRNFMTLLVVSGLLLLAVAVTSLLTVLGYTRSLARADRELRELNESLEDQVQVRTSDLSRANEEIQRFAYIVSHDLRSPLVNVMGFTAELEAGTRSLADLVDRAEAEASAILTDEAREAARVDLPEAIGFIRTSTERMDRLINAILKLSREGRRVITPEPLSMVRVIDTIRETLQHRLDERGAELLVTGQLPSLFSDRTAIEQVFGNVIENAVKYLDAGRPGRIEVRGRVAGDRAVFEIADNGRGIDPRDHARIFDLFRRSGAQDQPGEGIGLAHVRALTYRLGGIIDVASELGQGATFRITLPLRYTEVSGTSA